MDRKAAIQNIRKTLGTGGYSIGSWMQIPDSSVAEIMGQAGYDWVAVDLEHGAISTHQLPDLFRALELGGTLPLARLAQGYPKDCKQALDAGSGGVIIPMIQNAEHLRKIREACCWPPEGSRGVGFSRANLFGKHFNKYLQEAQMPLLIAMIEHIGALNDLDSILSVKGLDAILIGPYDLSASMNLTAQFENSLFRACMNEIKNKCLQSNIPLGIHIVQPNIDELKSKIAEDYRLIAYSIDAVFLNISTSRPRI